MNISYLSNFDFELLPETLRAFRLTFPHSALNLFDMTPGEQVRALEARKIDWGIVGLPPPATAGAIQRESIAQHRTVVVLPAKHSLARKRQLKLGELESMFFVGMSEQAHPGFREWPSHSWLQSLLRCLRVSCMAGMYHLKDLLLLSAQEGAEELLLEPDQPPRIRLHGKVRVLDGPLLTSDQVSELLRSIATDEQRRELELCGDAHFRYAADHLAQFSVRARTHDNRLHVKIKCLSSS